MKVSDIMRYVGQALSLLSLTMALVLLISHEQRYGLAIATVVIALLGLLVVIAAVFISNYKLDKVIVSDKEVMYRMLRKNLRKNCRKRARRDELTDGYIEVQRRVFTFIAVSECGVDPYRAQGDFIKIEHLYRRHS